MGIKKILPAKSIKNPTLRKRTDLSPFQKTAVHRYNYDGSDTFREWLLMLSPKERRQVKDLLGIEHSHWIEYYKMPFGLSKLDSMWMDVLKIVEDESKYNCGLRYHIENGTLSHLKKKYKLSIK